MKLKIGLIGYGRMGKTIHELLEKFDCEIGVIINNQENWNESMLKTCDVAIEFSLPESAYGNIKKCIELGIPVVSGTTGWLVEMEKIKELLNHNPDSSFLYGSNFSMGMNLFFLLNKYAANLMEIGDYHPFIEEIHHTAKLDKPSGTAITLAEGIMSNRSDIKGWRNDKTADPSELGIISIRQPDVPGTHIIHYENEIDKISIRHTAKSREGFAIGAISSAKWLIGKKGYFTIEDYTLDLLKAHNI